MSCNNQDKIMDIGSVFQIVEKIKNEPTLKIQLGHDTDIGGGRVNQDRYTVFTIPEHDVCAISVADGHCIETGHFAADITKKCLEELLKNRINELIENPVIFLEICCNIIHEEIRKRLVEIIEKPWYEVKVDESGVILKRKLESLYWNEIRGGTTFSIVVLIGKKIYIANLGDSTGLLCCKHPVLGLSNIKYEKDAANPTKVMPNGDVNGSLSTYIELTCDHSPESVDEYIRMRDFKCSDENPNRAELLCIYDTQNSPYKPSCPSVFNISESGIPTVREDDGSFQFYYKNVRKEKASYITDKDGESVLSVTRALGDFKLQTLGVTNKPEIRSVDLEPIFEQLKLQIDTVKVQAEKVETEKVETEIDNPVDPMTVCVVLCSDGVWDNWIYDDVCKFVMDPSCLNAIVDDQDKGAERVANSFMYRNKERAKRNFGNSADNATGIIMYITQKE
jgi:serine/threonine protein phosphatase PrpC